MIHKIILAYLNKLTNNEDRYHFYYDPDFDKACDLLRADPETDEKEKALIVLKKANIAHTLYQFILRMDQQEWEDFVVNYLNDV